MTDSKNILVPVLNDTIATAVGGGVHSQMILGLSHGTPLRQYLTRDSSSEAKNATVDASTSLGPIAFHLKPAVDRHFYVLGLTILMANDSTIDATDETLYGGLAALTTGVQLRTRTGSSAALDVDLIQGLNIQSTRDWIRAGAAISNIEANWVALTIDFRNQGAPIFLDGNAGDDLAVVMNDDLTGLSEHYFFAVGFEMNVA